MLDHLKEVVDHVARIGHLVEVGAGLEYRGVGVVVDEGALDEVLEPGETCQNG